MDIKGCIEITRERALNILVQDVIEMKEEGVPLDILLQASLELFVKILAEIEEHRQCDIYESLDCAEDYMRRYFGVFRGEE